LKFFQGGVAWFVGSWILAIAAGSVVFGIIYGLLTEERKNKECVFFYIKKGRSAIRFVGVR
jgi:hypothetical protein